MVSPSHNTPQQDGTPAFYTRTHMHRGVSFHQSKEAGTLTFFLNLLAVRCLDIPRRLMILDHFRLDGKNALVTGSHRGLGAAIAIALAEAGANVACHGRSSDPGEAPARIRGLGRKSAYFAGDVADAGVCASLIEKT